MSTPLAAPRRLLRSPPPRWHETHPGEPRPFTTMLADQILSPHNRRVFDYWQSLRRDGELPRRADFNPGRLRFALSRLVIVATQPGEAGFYRLVGTAISCGLDFDPTGFPVARLTPPRFLQTRIQRFNRILAGEALCNLRCCGTTAGRIGYWQELCLPFGDPREDGSIDILISTDLIHEAFGEKCTDPMEAFGVPLQSVFFQL